MTTAALAAVDQILNRGGDPGEVLGAVTRALVDRGGCGSAAIRSPDGVVHAQAGEPRPDERIETRVVSGVTHLADLVADGCADRALLERVALLVSPYCRS